MPSGSPIVFCVTVDILSSSGLCISVKTDCLNLDSSLTVSDYTVLAVGSLTVISPLFTIVTALFHN